MVYAIVKNGIVLNVAVSRIPLDESWIPCDDLPVCIGDAWDENGFYRNGEKVISEKESVNAQISDMQEALNLLGVSVDG